MKIAIYRIKLTPIGKNVMINIQKQQQNTYCPLYVLQINAYLEEQ